MDRALIHGDEALAFAGVFEGPGDFIGVDTSGSTGKPKTIRLPKRDMRASALATCRRFGIDASSVLVSPLSTAYIAGKMMVVRALVAGCELWSLPPSSSPLGELPAACRGIDLLAVVPAQLERLLDDPHRALVKTVLVGGAPVDEALERRVVADGLNAVASYGMTETCSHVALRQFGSDRFEALPGVTFSLDGRGCLVVDVPGMSMRRLVTNDEASLLSPTSFRWLGRHDNVINSGGVKINPETDEALLRPELPGVEFYITSRPSARWGEEAVIAVIARGAAAPTTDEAIIEAARRVLPPHHVPKGVVEVPREFTPTGKIKRRKF